MRRKFLTTSKFKFADPPKPALVKVLKAGVVAGLAILLVISTPASSKWNLLVGSKASFAMISGCRAADEITLVPLLIWLPRTPARAEGGVIAPPPFPPP